MLAFIHVVCVLICLAFAAMKWSTFTNKLKPGACIILAFIPVVNIILAIVIGNKVYKEDGEAIKRKFTELLAHFQ